MRISFSQESALTDKFLSLTKPEIFANPLYFSNCFVLQILGYLGTCVSKGPTVGQMWDCASSRIDHSECCKAKGVSGACLEYCAAHDGVPTNYLNYLFCLSSFDRVRECFETHLDTHPNLKGDS